jgi:hypothetical protein
MSVMDQYPHTNWRSTFSYLWIQNNQMQISHLRVSKPLFWSGLVVHPATQEVLVLLQNSYCASPHPDPCVDRLACHGPHRVQIVVEWVELALPPLGCAASCCWPPNVPVPISSLPFSFPLPPVHAYEPVRPDGPAAPSVSCSVTKHSQYKTNTGEVC